VPTPGGDDDAGVQSDPNATVSPPSEAPRYSDKNDGAVSDPNATVSPPSEVSCHNGTNSGEDDGTMA
jgi:hypothetical protein